MRLILTIAVISFCVFSLSAQDIIQSSQNSRQGKFYFYWGWNGAHYTKSNIHFEGENHKFTLDNVVAKHRPTTFSVDKYFNPINITIPQYSFRIGYFIKDNVNISFGFDHMKYVVQQNQKVKISGHIENTETQYDGVYADDDIVIAEDFLQLEHTDGLNYLNIELREMSELYVRSNISINLVKGAGVGLMFPKTDATLINNPRHDKFHVAGYGVAGMAGINLAIRKNFFIQTELKAGFINLPWVRTTSSKSDKASQNFFFYQYNIVFGTTINVRNKG